TVFPSPPSVRSGQNGPVYESEWGGQTDRLEVPYQPDKRAGGKNETLSKADRSEKWWDKATCHIFLYTFQILDLR
ncbi:MAG: hypothetical protein KJP02_12700, partial [Octadecabacter sp.]|nr:hypothetical protein [Octadecabacter sp.]